MKKYKLLENKRNMLKAKSIERNVLALVALLTF